MLFVFFPLYSTEDFILFYVIIILLSLFFIFSLLFDSLLPCRPSRFGVPAVRHQGSRPLGRLRRPFSCDLQQLPHRLGSQPPTNPPDQPVRVVGGRGIQQEQVGRRLHRQEPESLLFHGGRSDPVVDGGPRGREEGGAGQGPHAAGRERE